MLEVHEAAKIITETVSPDAKIIFGAIKDDKLKKGEVRVTVIATGFPAPGVAPRGTPLFSSMTRQAPEADVAPLGKIFNTPVVKEEKKVEAPKAAPAPTPGAPKPAAEDEEDEWGAVPSFLRRPKIK
jgi:cell division protein FtsZ